MARRTNCAHRGTTSACAENTSFRAVCRWNNAELPPRARRIPDSLAAIDYPLGTTSACAENTLVIFFTSSGIGNYLRVRGEYNIIEDTPAMGVELPPRARRILSDMGRDCLRVGTTSACAENTSGDSTGSGTPGNYLRVRGEYYAKTCTLTTPAELPPRARRIQIPDSSLAVLFGTTSACAENTWRRRAPRPLGRNYLRVRGEYAHDLALLGTTWELPPRARRILLPPTPAEPENGTTSACAENTPNK